MRQVRALALLLGSAGLACAFAITAFAQNYEKFTVTSSDRDLAKSARITRHAMASRTDKGKLLWNQKEIAPSGGVTRGESGIVTPGEGGGGFVDRYPGTLQNHGGHVLVNTTSHAVFVNPTTACPPNKCWGDPIGFLNDVGKSDFIHLVDQYVGVYYDGRYPNGQNYAGSVPPPAPAYTDDDMAAIAHSVAVQTGQHGYGHVFHIFLTPGTDVCSDSTFSQCYSPDNFNTFYFCAYHSSAVFSDIGEVVYSVEPYQNVTGCSVRPGTPNGMLVDSTNDVLSHEMIESITDPDGTAWWNGTSNALYGQEVADECSFVTFVNHNGYGDPSLVVLNGKMYAIQPEYSNSARACVTQ